MAKTMTCHMAQKKYKKLSRRQATKKARSMLRKTQLACKRAQNEQHDLHAFEDGGENDEYG